jgi:hypothetical protein
MEARTIVGWLAQQTDKEALRAIRDAADRRLHEVEHQDEYGAGTPQPGYKPVTVPGAKRQP